MAQNLSEHDCLEEARNHHVLGKRRRVHARYVERESDGDENQHMNYTIGHPGIYDSSSN